VLVHPRRWVVEERPVGPDAVHDLLVGWLDELGQREDITAKEDVASEDVAVVRES
jgi:hypothetical protein